MADYAGLLGALASGVNSGMDSYRTERSYQDEKKRKAEEDALKKRQLAMSEFSGGVQYDPTTGAVSYRPEKLEEQKYDKAIKRAGLLKDNMEIDESGNPIINEYGKQSRDLDLKKKQAEIGKLYAESKAKLAEDKLGKTLPATEVQSAGQANSATKALEDVRSLVNSNKGLFGPIAGRKGSIQSFLGMEGGVPSSQIEAQLDQRAQIIGTYLEGGKLAEGDIPKYKRMLPQINDRPEIAEAKINSLQRLIAQRQQATLETAGQAGYNVRDIRTTGINPEVVNPGANKENLNAGLLTAPVQADTMPKAGQVIEGYTFMGGDPAVKSNWRKK